MHVSAKDLGTGKENTVTISGSSNLSKEDIEKMKKDAEANEAEDAKFKELVEARNQADQLVIATEKTIKENESKLQGTEKEDIEKAIEELKKVKDGDDIEAIRKGIEELSKVSQGFATRMYQEAAAAQQGAQGGEAAGENNNSGADDVEDAEVVD